jgi:hypothetical protein
MDEQQPRPESTTAAASGSAWAELDETFFRLVADMFPQNFCAGASALLASNDDDAEAGVTLDTPDEVPSVIVVPEARLSHEATLELINQEIDRELALRRAAMRRHPSRRRF